jgi:hypothetical protein
MPAVTDLTWGDLNQGLRKITQESDGNFISIITPDTTFAQRKLAIFIDDLIPGAAADLAGAGVIKLLTILLDAARLQQETLNQGKAAGEKLTAFPPATFGTLANGFAPITRTLTARAVLSSATQIVGTNA